MAAKSKLSRAGTMQATAKDAVAYLYPNKKGGRRYDYLKGAVVDDLHSMGVDVPDTSTEAAQADPVGAKAGSSKGKKGSAKKPAKPAMKRDSTMAKTVAEAKRLLDNKVTFAEGKKTRSTKKASPAKPALKRAGTMQKTAKEGKSFLKRSKGKKGKGKK